MINNNLNSDVKVFIIIILFIYYNNTKLTNNKI